MVPPPFAVTLAASATGHCRLPPTPPRRLYSVSRAPVIANVPAFEV